MKTLIFGATGFIGEALVKKFLNDKIPLRLAVRSPEKLPKEYLENDLIEVTTADLDAPDSLKELTTDIKTIYYLVHALDSEDFIERETKQAKNLAQFLTADHQLIYLGGLATNSNSDHMKSRHQVGAIFNQTKAQVLEVRASIVIGVGGSSFEMMRALAWRFPVIIKAPWNSSLCQPVYLDDLIHHLADLKDNFQDGILEIAGTEVLSYPELLIKVAQISKLKRPVLTLPIPKEALMIALPFVLPEYFHLAKSLLTSLQTDSIIGDRHPKVLCQTTLDQALAKTIEESSSQFKKLSDEDIKKLVHANEYSGDIRVEKIQQSLKLNSRIEANIKLVIDKVKALESKVQSTGLFGLLTQKVANFFSYEWVETDNQQIVRVHLKLPLQQHISLVQSYSISENQIDMQFFFIQSKEKLSSETLQNFC